MNGAASEDKERRTYARRDIAIVVVGTLAAAFFCVEFDVSEAVSNWARPHERLQLDELPAVLLAIAIGLAWFSSRRYFEVKRQLRMRRRVETRLAEALAENQRLAVKYVDMQEAERKALARDLHDELGQYVNVIKLDAVALRESAAGHSVQQVARAMIVNIDRVYDVLGGLIRQLRPAGFDDLGLLAALEHCLNEWRSRLPAVAIEFSARGDFDELDETRSLVLFRLVQEALTNVARHSAATQVRIRIERIPGGQGIAVQITDNGRGTDLGLPRAGLGLIGMRERVTALGGTVTLSGAPGKGFAVAAFLPLPERVDA